jgi:hypothetical protein
MAKRELIFGIERFLDQKDISKKNANEIESRLARLEIKHGLMDETLLILASYTSDSGEYIFDEDQVAHELKKY